MITYRPAPYLALPEAKILKKKAWAEAVALVRELSPQSNPEEAWED